ncbi:MAG: DNA-formamidopyrimidine glycosylase family protein, partial [Pseudomonadota bacterium]
RTVWTNRALRHRRRLAAAAPAYRGKQNGLGGIAGAERGRAMPEGHTIHRAANQQRRMLAKKAVAVSSPQGRFADGAKQLDARTCTSVEAFGKHLIYRFDDDRALHIHLGLFGKFKTKKRPEIEPKGAVRVRMLSETHCVDINGPNTCEILDPAGLQKLVGRIGPDVLRNDADPERAFARISKSRAPIGRLLMDQSVIAGIGNIYRTEILWRQRLHPDMPGNAIDRDMFESIWNDSVELLKIGVKRNAIITVDGAAPSHLRYGERTNIFNKQTCPCCSGAVTRTEIAGRRAFLCETCQPLL